MSFHGRAAMRSKPRAALSAALGLALWTASAARAQVPAPADQQLVLAAAGAVKILVRGTGWFRVGQPALVAAGLSAGASPGALQLFADGVEQALTVTGNGDNRFTADEAIEFYGVGRDTAWTDVRTYWLVTGGSGARVAVQAPPPAGAPRPASYPHTEAVVGRSIYVAAVRNGDASNFFGAAVSTTPVTITVPAPHPILQRWPPPVLTVGLQGMTATAHTVDVTLNGLALGTCTLQGVQDATCSYPATGLVAGANSLTLAAHDPTDYTVTDSISVSYSHLYAADGDSFAFTAVGGSHVDIGGFTAGDVRVVDITDPTRPPRAGHVRHRQLPAPSTPSSTFRSVRRRALFTRSPAPTSLPPSRCKPTPSHWSAPLDGELLIPSHTAFLNTLGPLVARREAEGWRGATGRSGRRLRRARIRRQVRRRGPRLHPGGARDLAGAAALRPARRRRHVRPRNFLGRATSTSPTRLIDTAAMETASDDWFVDDESGRRAGARRRATASTHRRPSRGARGQTVGYPGIADVGRGACSSATGRARSRFSRCQCTVVAAQVSDRMPVGFFRQADPGRPRRLLVEARRRPVPGELPRPWFGGGVERPAG